MAADPSTPASTQPRRKKIVICCDGTGNEFSAPNPHPHDKNAGRNSNIVKLYTALQVDNDQVAYYHPGVGTMGSPNATNPVTSAWSRAMGLAFGAGFRDNVIDAYRYLMEVYNDNGGNGNGDEVYIFGFSRGAYTARALAGLLHGYGLLCRGNEGHIPYAWRLYAAQHEDRKKQTVDADEAFKETYSHAGFNIQFVGVFDTVSSVGWISTPLRLFNLAQNGTILRGRHAISIDERRCFFQDELWGKSLPGQDLLQVWFAGVHSDVGGSYLQNESGLSDITLRWMLAEVGLHRGTDGLYPDTPGIRLNDERYNLVLGSLPHPTVSPQLLCHPPTSSPRHESLCGAWWILEFIPHLYFNKNKAGGGMEQRRVPLGLRRRQLPRHALVHGSVARRLADPALGYKPGNISLHELAALPGALPVCADGTEYLQFTPHNRPPNNALLDFCDRFAVTWFFTLFDIVVVLPLLLFVVLFGLAALALLAAKLLTLCWRVADRFIHPFTFCFHWLAMGFVNGLRGLVHHLW